MQIPVDFMTRALNKAATLKQTRFVVEAAGRSCVLNLMADRYTTIDFTDANYRRIDIFIFPETEGKAHLFRVRVKSNLYFVSAVDGGIRYDFNETNQVEPGLQKIVEDGLIALFVWLNQA